MADAPSHTPTPRGRHVRGPWRPASFSRSVSLVLLSAVLPGSAQITARRHAVLGRVALTAWVLLLLVALGVVGYVLVTGDMGAVVSLAVRPNALALFRGAAVVVAAVWLVLLIDAWRLSRPGHWRPGQRVVSGLTALALAVVGVVPAVAAARYAGIQRDLVDTVFQEEPDRHSFTAQRRRQERPDGRVNVLLLGGDGGDGRDGVRTDSMQIASVDRRTGKAVLVALPRSLQNAPFPEGTPMDGRFPNGFDAYQGLLNAVYVYGAENPDLFPGASNPGAEAIMQAASEITGLNIDYYVLVNLEGFTDLVDAMDGIDLYVSERVPIGGKLSLDGSTVLAYPSGYIEPSPEPQHLDGYHALWFARSRFNSDDYSRMRRQRCVMSAFLEQAEPRRVLANYQDIASSTKNLVETNIPQSALPELVEIALDARKHDVASVTFTRKVVDTVDPDFGEMRQLVERAIKESVSPGSTTLASPSPSATTPGGTPTSSPTPDEEADEEPEPSESAEPTDVTADLDAVCRPA